MGETIDLYDKVNNPNFKGVLSQSKHGIGIRDYFRISNIFQPRGAIKEYSTIITTNLPLRLGTKTEFDTWYIHQANNAEFRFQSIQLEPMTMTIDDLTCIDMVDYLHELHVRIKKSAIIANQNIMVFNSSYIVSLRLFIDDMGGDYADMEYTIKLPVNLERLTMSFPLYETMRFQVAVWPPGLQELTCIANRMDIYRFKEILKLNHLNILDCKSTSLHLTTLGELEDCMKSLSRRLNDGLDHNGQWDIRMVFRSHTALDIMKLLSYIHATPQIKTVVIYTRFHDREPFATYTIELISDLYFTMKFDGIVCKDGVINDTNVSAIQSDVNVFFDNPAAYPRRRKQVSKIRVLKQKT